MQYLLDSIACPRGGQRVTSPRSGPPESTSQCLSPNLHCLSPNLLPKSPRPNLMPVPQSAHPQICPNLSPILTPESPGQCLSPKRAPKSPVPESPPRAIAQASHYLSQNLMSPSCPRVSLSPRRLYFPRRTSLRLSSTKALLAMLCPQTSCRQQTFNGGHSAARTQFGNRWRGNFTFLATVAPLPKRQ